VPSPARPSLSSRGCSRRASTAAHTSASSAAPPGSSSPARSPTTRVRSNGLRASRSGRRRSRRAWRTASSNSVWERTSGGGRAGGGGVTSSARARSVPSSRRASIGAPRKAGGDSPVAAAPHHGVGPDRAGQVGQGEVVVPSLRLGQREEVPGQVGGAQVALEGQDRRGVERRGGGLVGLPVEDETGLGCP